MTRSRQRKLRRLQAKKTRHLVWKAVPVASALLTAMHSAHAQDQPEGSLGLAEVVVTAQKRVENLQDVPLSIQAIGNQQLEEMNIKKFDDYAKLLPSVSFQSAGPSFEHTYIRGVTSGGDGNHSGSLPSVGTYLDEMPVTTIDGDLNIHVYDIARVEALSGPQGTLYGASSEAGTIRIITNKPDPHAFAAGYDLDGSRVNHGSFGWTAEGFVNIPLADFAAVRLVGWDEHDSGFIDNVHGTVTFPTSGLSLDNASMVKSHYNDVETKGGRAALRVDLNDSWTITPQVMGQVQDTNGNFAYNPKLGDLLIQHYFPDTVHDSWVQSSLTVEGRISNFDIVYAGGYLVRNTHESSDYADYSLFYDTAFGSGAYFRDNAGNLINPAQHIIGRDRYSKMSHELRITSPKEYPLRFTAGGFFQRQVHYILQDYEVNNVGSNPLGSVPPNDLSVPGWPGSVWLTDEVRVDRDKAVFGELTYDLTSQLSFTGGIRHYTFENTLDGYYGFNSTFSSHEGVATCFNAVPFNGAPCSDLAGRTSDSGNLYKGNLTYKLDTDRMIYATYSRGFRPGGVNRNGGGTLPPYQADFLNNYEIGWKTSWLDNRLRWNGAVFLEKWQNFQFSFLGANALTIIANAGNATIKGLESELQFVVFEGLTITGAATFLQANLTEQYCAQKNPTTPCDVSNEQFAPDGAELPVTPRFKGNITGRYVFDLAPGVKGHVQASEVYVGARWADLRLQAREALGQESAYALLDLATGVEWNRMTAEVYLSNAFDRRPILDRFAECDVANCGQVNIYNVTSQPRTIGIRFGQRF